MMDAVVNGIGQVIGAVIAALILAGIVVAVGILFLGDDEEDRAVARGNAPALPEATPRSEYAEDKNEK